MTMTSYPNGFTGGVAVRGVPLLNTYFNQVFWVDSNTGSNGNSGKTPGKPFATIDYAIGKCAVNKGDVILVAPNHAETISGAGTITCDVAGVAIMGLGWGTLRPVLNFTATDSTVAVTAANVYISNIQFECEIDALVVGVPISAAGCTLEKCSFSQPTSTNDALIWVQTTAAGDDLTIVGCDFRASHAGPTEAVQLVGADRAKIIGNYFIGSYSTAAINGITTASTEILIAWNTISNSVTDKLAIDLVASCTGRIEYNTGTVVSTAGITDANIIDAASCQLAENYFSDAAGETGQIVGVVSA